MDIQVSSNFERLLFEAGGRDSLRIRDLMSAFADHGSFALSEAELGAIGSVFAAARADEAETSATIARLYRESGYMADPHTAVGLAAAAKVKGNGSIPMIALSTAHPAKFPAAIEAATGRLPAIPARLQAALAGKEDFSIIDADPDTVRGFIAARAHGSLASA